MRVYGDDHYVEDHIPESCRVSWHDADARPIDDPHRCGLKAGHRGDHVCHICRQIEPKEIPLATEIWTIIGLMVLAAAIVSGIVVWVWIAAVFVRGLG